MLGISRWGQRKGDEKGAKLAKVVAGMSQISKIHVYQPEFAYYGKTVGPKDKNKVPAPLETRRWPLQVVFGDLHAETVPADRLRTLEAK